MRRKTPWKTLILLFSACITASVRIYSLYSDVTSLQRPLGRPMGMVIRCSTKARRKSAATHLLGSWGALGPNQLLYYDDIITTEPEGFATITMDGAVIELEGNSTLLIDANLLAQFEEASDSPLMVHLPQGENYLRTVHAAKELVTPTRPPPAAAKPGPAPTAVAVAPPPVPVYVQEVAEPIGLIHPAFQEVIYYDANPPPVQFEWMNSKSARPGYKYSLEIAGDVNFKTGLSSVATQKTQAKFRLHPGTYFWRVLLLDHLSHVVQRSLISGFAYGPRPRMKAPTARIRGLAQWLTGNKKDSKKQHPSDAAQ